MAACGSGWKHNGVLPGKLRDELVLDGDRGDGDPDGDLRKANRPHADHLAGQHFARLDRREQDLEDARGLLFDDGARHVHPVEQDDEVHQEEHGVGAAERALRVGGLQIDGRQQCANVARDHAGMHQPLTGKRAADGIGDAVLGDDVRAGAWHPLIMVATVRGCARGDDQETIQATVPVLQPRVEHVAGIGLRRRIDIHLRRIVIVPCASVPREDRSQKQNRR